MAYSSLNFNSPTPTHAIPNVTRNLEATILKLLAARGSGKTICPSEAARELAASDTSADWQPLMQPIRLRLRENGRSIAGHSPARRLF